MAPTLLMLLGRTLSRRNETGWAHETIAPSGDAVLAVAEFLRSSPGTARRAGLVLIYEPEGLIHDCVETPDGKRGSFAEIARIRDEYPAVASEHLAWGMEPPVLAPGGTYSTVLHAEMMPGLSGMVRACAAAGVRLKAAWSAYTAAMALLPAGRDSGRGVSVFLLLPDYVGLARTGGEAPVFKGWSGPMREADWTEVSLLLGEAGLSGSPNASAAARRHKGTLVVTAAGQERRCPFWDALLLGGRVSAVMGVDAVAEAALGLPLSHPANLVGAFPRPIRLNGVLAAAAVAGVAGTATLGALAWNGRPERAAAMAAGNARQAALEATLARLTSNERRIALLRADERTRQEFAPSHGHEALAGIAAAVPDAATLVSLDIARDGGFQFEAMVIAGGFNQGQMKADLERAGFELSPGTGWAYDAESRRLKARGVFKPPGT